jgi:hypothetical protein
MTVSGTMQQEPGRDDLPVNFAWWKELDTSEKEFEPEIEKAVTLVML